MPSQQIRIAGHNATADRPESADPRVCDVSGSSRQSGFTARRFLVVLLAGFAAFALILASFGIYAVISFSVSQRVQEIGISDGARSVRHGRATPHRDGNASYRGCADRWVYSRLECIQDRSTGCIAVELKETNERVRQDANIICRFSRIRNADLGRFTLDRLISIINRLGARVEIRVKVRSPAHLHIVP